ncbi:MAG: hypothetical protein LBQ43_00295 [Holosporales bacterium]|nr:hypothetical protein [Holosporales bacterium]
MLFASVTSCFDWNAHASTMNARPAIEDVTKLCGHPISELAKSAKPGDTNLLQILFGVLRKGVGTPEEREKSLDSLINAAHAGDRNALCCCAELWQMSNDVSNEVQDATGLHIQKRVSKFFRQIADEGNPGALLALEKVRDVVGVRRHPEVRASFRKLILSLIARRNFVETMGLMEFIERLTPEEQVNFMRSLVEFAEGGNCMALHALRTAIAFSSEKTRRCFYAFLQKLKDNNSPSAKIDNLINEEKISASEWLDNFKHTGQFPSCSIEHVIEDASPEQMEQILLATLSPEPGIITTIMHTKSEKVISALERLANVGNTDAKAELGLFLVKYSPIADGKVREGIHLLLEILKQGQIRIRERISYIKFSKKYSERAAYIQDVLREQISTGNCKAEANVLLCCLLPTEQKEESFRLLLEADKLGKDVSIYVGTHFDRTDKHIETKVLDYLTRRAEAGSFDAKYFLGVHTRGSKVQAKRNEAASLVIEALMHSQTSYPPLEFGSLGADSPELKVLRGITDLYFFAIESNGRPRLADFSAAFSEKEH